MKYVYLIVLFLSLGCENKHHVTYEFKGTPTNEFVFKSKITGIEYPINVYVPENYSVGESMLPVIYATDGQWCFWPYAKVLDELSVNVVLVAISQGPDRRRSIDYTFKGNKQYLQFFQEELFPFVEDKFNVDPQKRTITGTSLGGAFVGYALLKNGLYSKQFQNVIAIDSGFRADDENGSALVTIEQYSMLLDDENIDGDNVVPRLFITNSSTSGFLSSGYEFIDMLRAKGYPERKIIHKIYDETHSRVNYPSFIDAVKYIYLN